LQSWRVPPGNFRLDSKQKPGIKKGKPEVDKSLGASRNHACICSQWSQRLVVQDPATEAKEFCPRTARLSMEFSSGPLQILGGEKFVALNAIACTEPGLRLVSAEWIGQISGVKGQAGNGKADARQDRPSRRGQTTLAPVLFLSGQRLFEALPSFGIETKDLALFDLQKSSF
jgi:hypothetical protein